MNGSLIFGSIAAAVIALLSGLGIGSGGLFVILLTGLLGFDPIAARGLNLLFFVLSASAAFLVHFFSKKLRLFPKLILLSSIFAVIGTIIGTAVGGKISPDTLRKIFGCLLILSGAHTVIRTARAKRVKSEK